MAKKYYVVWKGRKTGIFTSWAECKAQVDKFAGARYKSFPTQEEAESAFGNPRSGGKVAPVPGGTKTVTKAGSKVASKTDSKVTKPKKAPLTQAKIDAMPFEVKIFTDGASDPNPGEAGSGIAVYENNTLAELWYGIYQSLGTNNTAELNGLNQAFLIAKEKLAKGYSVAIYCDSTYAIQCITQWAKGWESKGWKKSGGEIKNLDLIKSMYALYQEIEKKLTIHHVNGHVGIEGNELADRMSIVAIDAKEEGLSLYRETADIAKILALRAG